MMTIENDSDFKQFMNNVVLRTISDNVLLIDPCVSYNTENAIVLKGIPEKHRNNKNYIFEHARKNIYSEFKRNTENSNSTIKLNNIDLQSKHPWKVGIELTGKCNFDCLHCYAKPLHHIETPSYQVITDLLDNLFEAGVLFVWFTGGECTIRPDFDKIYIYAKLKGFVVSILTNGTGIPNLIYMFLKYPPQIIKVSQYGSTEQDYENITGSRSNYFHFTNAIDHLKKQNINFTIQSVILEQNKSSVTEMVEYCNACNVSQQLNYSISPRVDGDMTPIKYKQEPPKSTVEVGSEVNVIVEKFKTLKNEREQITSTGEFFCNVGISECFVTADLMISLCIMYRKFAIKYSSNIKFLQQFQSLSVIRKDVLKLDDCCNSCYALLACNICPFYRDIYKQTGELDSKCNTVFEKMNTIMQHL